MKKIILITGASSGIGAATARAFAALGYNLILTARREEILSSLKEELERKENIKVLTLCFDVQNAKEVKENLINLSDEWKSIDVLVNNAGLAAGLNPIQKGDLDDWEQMIDTNIKGLLYVSRIISKFMIKNGKGHIINIGSIAGTEVYPNGNVYCATKHAVDALSKAMRIDLLKHGIRVSQVRPGAVETEFSMVRFKNDEKRAKAVYEGFQPLRAKDIADCIVYVASLASHININDMLVMPTAQASIAVIHKKAKDTH